MNDIKIKPPTWFWILAVIALAWNLLGVMAYLGQAFAGEEMLNAMAEAERNLIENRPAWATGSFAVAVFGGFFGALMLLLRKSAAVILFIISLIGLIVQMIYNLFIAESTMDYGPGAIFMTITIPIFAIVLVIISRRARGRGWIG